MFSSLPSAPVASPNWSTADLKPVKPRDRLIFNLSLTLRQKVTDHLNSFSQLLHGKQVSKRETDELTKESQSLVVQLMSLRVRSDEEKLLAKINREEGIRNATSMFVPNFSTRLVSELTWSNRERIVNGLVTNFTLGILNKAYLTEGCKIDLLRENDELVRLLSTLPTEPTSQPADKLEETLSSSGE